MVTVSISETYDLHTVVNKMTLIGIHTPTKELIQKSYPGLAMNYRYFRVKSVDCVLSTAQQLPLGVDQIGLDAGQIRPQDMMNPILYKAVSNDSWSTLEARLNGLLVNTASNPLHGSMAEVENDDVSYLADEHGVYYSLLSNRDGFRAAHPQQGLSMKGLKPLVFEKWWTHGENGGGYADAGIGLDPNNDATALKLDNLYAKGFRGLPHPMPKLNTTYLTGAGNDGEARGTHWEDNGMGAAGGVLAGLPANFQIQMPDIPPVMLGCIILPPCSATTGILYYRMVTRAWIEFTDVRPIQEITSFKQMDVSVSPLVYHSDYVEQSKNMDALTDMVDIKNGEIEKIMEGR